MGRCGQVELVAPVALAPQHCTGTPRVPPASHYHKATPPEGTGTVGTASLTSTYCQDNTRHVASLPAPCAWDACPSSARQWQDNGDATGSPVNELSFVPQPTLHQARPLRTVPSWD